MRFLLDNASRGREETVKKNSKIIIDNDQQHNQGEEENVHETSYVYRRNDIIRIDPETIRIRPVLHEYRFLTQLRPRKTGLMLVGLGGNNGTTLVGMINANRDKINWRTRNGIQSANYLGSITQSTTVHLGWDGHEQVHVPFSSLLPLLDPHSLVIDGWDINNADLYTAMQRAKVFDPELQDHLRSSMENVYPRRSIYYPHFIAGNQSDRANHILPGEDKQEHLEEIRRDVRQFKQQHHLETVIVLWTASTERFVTLQPGLNLTSSDLLNAIARSDAEIAPSHIFATAAILEGAHFINGSPQNTLLPGIVDLAEQHNVFIAGDDFKSGQTKLKSALVEFLVSSGLKPESIVSYNHLGNNDGKNLSEQAQFRSKEITKSSVVEDMVAANHLIYPDSNKGPDHVIVIKYVPWVGDQKRAMDEYCCSIAMGGQQTLVIHNTCEDSLLAAPLILDLVILTELFSRIKYSTGTSGFDRFHSVLSLLSVLLKAPMVPSGTPIGNAFMRQLGALTKLVKVCAGLASDNDLQLEFITQLNTFIKEDQSKMTNGHHNHH